MRLAHGGRSQLLFALHQSSIGSQLFVENRDFLPTPSVLDAPSEHCHNVWYGKNYNAVATDGENF